MELMHASRQWASRPNDERFLSLLDLNSYCKSLRQSSASKVIATKGLQAVAVDGDREALRLNGPNGIPVDLTHWSFSQLATQVGAPAGYLRSLPGELSADLINYGLIVHDAADVGVLLTKQDGAERATMRAMTGPNYGRIWNSTITQSLVNRFGDGLTGEFCIPGEFGQKVEITKQNTTLYASDRDMFVFLADETRKIPVHNRRDGKTSELSRGFFMANSETGAGKFWVATFLFDYACSNRIVWGAQGFKEFSIRHTAKAPHRWVDEALPMIQDYTHSSSDGVVNLIAAAQRKKVDDVEAFLKGRKFTGAQVAAIQAAHMEDEQRPMETLWDVTTGVTAYARGIQYQNERVQLEREGGKILDLAI